MFLSHVHVCCVLSIAAWSTFAHTWFASHRTVSALSHSLCVLGPFHTLSLTLSECSRYRGYCDRFTNITHCCKDRNEPLAFMTKQHLVVQKPQGHVRTKLAVCCFTYVGSVCSDDLLLSIESTECQGHNHFLFHPLSSGEQTQLCCACKIVLLLVWRHYCVWSVSFLHQFPYSLSALSSSQAILASRCPVFFHSF